MDARLHGFRLNTNSCGLRDLSRYLCTIEPIRFDLFDRERSVFAGERDGKCAGVVVSFKGQRRFPEMEDGEELRVHIHEAEEGRTPFDFNFFAFDLESGGGVYQAYRGSCSLHRFGMLLELLYDDLARNDCNATTETLLNRTTRRRLKKDQLEFSVVLRRGTFEEQIRKLNRVGEFTYDIVTQKDMSDAFAPLSRYARLERRTVRFKGGTRGQSILPTIRDLAASAVHHAMFRVVGTDDEGDVHRIDLAGPQPDEFARDHVDALADETVLVFGDITRSPYVDTMLRVLEQNQALFGPEE